MSHDAAELARRLARCAQAVCAYYLSNGRRRGRYWHVGDAHNTPGRSLYVRLSGPDSGPAAAGKWTDAATGQYGDLTDLIRLRLGHSRLSETLEEARVFLSLPAARLCSDTAPSTRDTKQAAQRLFRASLPATGTLAQSYLRARGIDCDLHTDALRFHPSCYYRAHDGAPLQAWPALIAAVTDLSGSITGVHRTWLARDGASKAPLPDPRRAMGQLLGHGVRFGIAIHVLAAAEGIENALTLRTAFPDLPVLAALSANHLSALVLPATLKRLYVAVDRDADGLAAASRLMRRSHGSGIRAYPLIPAGEDWNTDLMQRGITFVRQSLLDQFADTDELRCTPEADRVQRM